MSLTTRTTENKGPQDTAGNSGCGEIVRLNPLEDSSWDARLSLMPGATCFHSVGWMRVLHESYGYKPCCFASLGRSELAALHLEQDEERHRAECPGHSGPGILPGADPEPNGFSALLPMMEVSSIWSGRRGVSLPFTDFCEALGAPGSNCQPLVEHALRHAGERSWSHLEFRGKAGIPASAPVAARHLAHRLDLGKEPDVLWSALSSAARRSIRKARDSGVVVSSGHDETAMRGFFRLHCLTRKRHGVPPQPYAFFSNIRRHLLDQGLASILLASDKSGKTIAAAVFLHFGKHVIYKFGASDIGSQDLRANQLLMWEAIGRYAAEGMRELHMGRTETDHPGLRRYKLAWGAGEEELAYYRYAPGQREFVSGGKPGSGWTRKVFRRVPVPLSRMIGTMAYRHIA